MIIVLSFNTVARNRKSDHHAFGLPVARNFATQVASNGSTFEQSTKAYSAFAMLYRRPAMLRPGQQKQLTILQTRDIDVTSRRGQSTIFRGIRRELVQEQCEARHNTASKRNICAAYHNPCPALVGLTVMWRKNRAD